MAGEAQGVGAVSDGEARGAVQQAPKVPNSVLRKIRKDERGESQREFADAMARAAWEMGVEVYPDDGYVQRLESGSIKWPHRTYRTILEKLCGRPIGQLGFSPTVRARSSEVPSNANTALREAIWESGIEVIEFARKIEVHPKTVERWIIHGVIPRPMHRWKSALILGIDESELWSDSVIAREIQEHDHKRTPKRASGLKADSDFIGVPALDKMSPSLANSPISVLIEASTEDAAQITMSAGREAINPLAIEQLYEEISRLSIAYIGSTVETNRQILQRATELRKALKGLLANTYRKPSQSTDIYLMIGLLSGICAYSCLDLNHPDKAMTQARTSFMMGDLIGHDGLRAWALGTRSLIARFQERYPEALSYAREGIQYATTGAALVRLRCGEGQTLAHMGNSADSIHFLNLAKDAREDVGSPDIMGGLFTFSEAKQTYYTGSSLQWLPGEKNAKSAQAESVRAIQMFESANPESRSPGDVLLAHIYLGNSRLTLGEIEGSMDALRPVLDLPLSSRSSWQRKRMRGISARLEKGNFSNSRLAISARDEISSFVEVPKQHAR